MERVLPNEEIKKKLAALAVGLAADCDAPERDVDKIMRENLAGANVLPFAGFLSHDGQWVAGFSGYKDVAAFLAVLKQADESPLLKATPAVQKKLAGLATRAAKAAEKGDWKGVLRATADAARTTGRCPERDTLKDLEAKARAWAAARLDEVVRGARKGDDIGELRKVLGEVRKHFAKEPEGADADAGFKALLRLSKVREAPQDAPARAQLREKAAKEFTGTRWAAIFQEGPADGPAPVEEPDEGADEPAGDIEEGGD